MVVKFDGMEEEAEVRSHVFFILVVIVQKVLAKVLIEAYYLEGESEVY